MSNFGQRLQKVQKEARFSQAEMAQQLGISISSWKNYLTGKRVPGVDIAEKICKELEVSPDWLLLGEGFMTFDGGSGFGLSMEYKYSISRNLTFFYSKKVFLAKQIIGLLHEINELDRTDEATEMFGWGRMNIDEFSGGMKRIEELELSAFAVASLKVVSEYVRTQTGTSKSTKPMLPERVSKIVVKASKSGEETEKVLKDLMAQLKREWSDLAGRK